tara:strand:- start:410 stop:1846 length:1437 start_codon:yes stop_codon:yes gene_type:complete
LTRVVITIAIEDLATARRDCLRVPATAYAVELRCDYCSTMTVDQVAELMSLIHVPCIITLRPARQGGKYLGDEVDRIALLASLLSLKPQYMDIEYDVSGDVLERFKSLSPTTQFIRSYHDLSGSPDDLSAIIASMYHPAVFLYKLVTTAKSSIDTLKMLCCVQAHTAEHDFIGHCMGEDGFFGRIAGAVLGNYWTYASLDQPSAVLQHMPSMSALERTYRLLRRTTGCDLYALIGDPVEASVGHEFHNERFAVLQQSALYLKIRLQAHECAEFFRVIQPLPFRGISVTMPLKQTVMEYVDVTANRLAVNTLTRQDTSWCGSNTDGQGAIKTILARHALRGKKVWVLGCGGAGLAIVQALIEQDVEVTVINRTLHPVLQKLPINVCQWSDAIDYSTQIVDGVIYALPSKVMNDRAIESVVMQLLKHRPWVLDCNYPATQQQLAQRCIQVGCVYLSGEQFFEQQAIAQSEYWLEAFKQSG